MVSPPCTVSMHFAYGQNALIRQNDIELYLAHRLNPDQTRLIEAEMKKDPALAAKIEVRRQERQTFLHDSRRKNFATLAEVAQASPKFRLETYFGKSGRSRWLLAGAMTLAALIIAPQFVSETVHPTVGVKGGVSVQAAVLENGRTYPFSAPQVLHPGARISLSVDDAQGGFITVLLEEEHGKVMTLYRPEAIGRQPPGLYRLPGSIELDDRPGRERLYVLITPEAVDPDEWQREIVQAKTKSGFDHQWLPTRGTRMTTLEYRKEAIP